MKTLAIWFFRTIALILEKPGKIFPLLWLLIATLDLFDVAGVIKFVDSPSLASLPDVLEAWIILIWMAAGIFFLLSTFPHKIVSREWLWEKLTWTAAGFGWMSYGIAVFSRNPRSLLVWGSMVCLTFMSAVYFSKVNRHEKSVRYTWESIRRDRDEDA